jgi:hypothetical protein
MSNVPGPDVKDSPGAQGLVTFGRNVVAGIIRIDIAVSARHYLAFQDPPILVAVDDHDVEVKVVELVLDRGDEVRGGGDQFFLHDGRVRARETTNRKSILPLQPDGPPKSGWVPMSGNVASVVEVPGAVGGAALG